MCSPAQEKVGTGSIEAIICPVYSDLRIRATVSKKLTEDYVGKLKRELKLATRIAKVQQALFETMRNPNEQIVSALIKASNTLSHLNAKPIEVLNVWPIESFLSEAMQNRR